MLGAMATPYVNSFADTLTQIPQTDKAVSANSGVYPGESFCNKDSPHALWHSLSANGLLEIVFLADYVNGALKR